MNDQTPIRQPLINIENHDHDVQQVLSRRFTDPASTNLDDLGRMSAEAVLTQYEAAAISVEDMGISVKAMVKKLGEALIECGDDMKHLNETAVEIREKGKHYEALIGRVNDLSKSIRDACAEFKKQVGAH
jgi:hypothetical protein